MSERVLPVNAVHEATGRKEGLLWLPNDRHLNPRLVWADIDIYRVWVEKDRGRATVARRSFVGIHDVAEYATLGEALESIGWAPA